VYKAAGNISAADIALRQCSEKAATTVSCITLQVWLHPPPQTHAGGLWRDCVCVPDDVTVGCVVCYLAAWRLDRAALAFARWLGNAVSQVRPLVCGGGLRHRSQQAEAQKGDDEMFQYIYHHADTCQCCTPRTRRTSTTRGCSSSDPPHHPTVAHHHLPFSAGRWAEAAGRGRRHGCGVALCRSTGHGHRIARAGRCNVSRRVGGNARAVTVVGGAHGALTRARNTALRFRDPTQRREGRACGAHACGAVCMSAAMDPSRLGV
jgi:hypothetical protein